MSELREAAKEALRWMEHARLHLTIKERMHPDGLGLYDNAAEALRAALAQPKTELRDQHKAFTHWYFGLRGINEANFSPEDLAWAAWKAALAQPEAEAGVSWDGHNVRGDADSIAEVRRLIEFEDARQGTKPATVEDIRIYDAIAANYVNAQPEAEPEPVAEPVAWEARWNDPEEGASYWVPTQNPDFYRSRPTYEVRPLYTHPPRDEWRPARKPPEDGRRVLIWVATESGEETFRPAYCPVGGWTSVFGGETLVAWRDVTPPGSDNIHNIRPLYAHPPRDEWRLASEPPEDDRSVLVWMPGKLGGLAIGRCSRGNWSPYYLGSPVTHWRDVTPPTEGAK